MFIREVLFTCSFGNHTKQTCGSILLKRFHSCFCSGPGYTNTVSIADENEAVQNTERLEVDFSKLEPPESFIPRVNS